MSLIRFGLALALTLGFYACGCSQIIGVEDATCDPKLPECQADGASSVSQLCEEYCISVMANCNDEFSVYVGPETCRSVCKVLPPGIEGDQEVNTVQCRLHQAQLALILKDPATHCPGAGPGGNDLCGSNCEGLCSIMLGTCPQYQSATECSNDCKAVPDLSGFSIAQDDGDSRQCRLWHASAATQAPIPHCVHAAGGSPCN
jgi:hypothetical protein